MSTSEKLARSPAYISTGFIMLQGSFSSWRKHISVSARHERGTNLPGELIHSSFALENEDIDPWLGKETARCGQLLALTAPEIVQNPKVSMTGSALSALPPNRVRTSRADTHIFVVDHVPWPRATIGFDHASTHSVRHTCFYQPPPPSRGMSLHDGVAYSKN